MKQPHTTSLIHNIFILLLLCTSSLKPAHHLPRVATPMGRLFNRTSTVCAGAPKQKITPPPSRSVAEAALLLAAAEGAAPVVLPVVLQVVAPVAVTLPIVVVAEYAVKGESKTARSLAKGWCKFADGVSKFLEKDVFPRGKKKHRHSHAGSRSKRMGKRAVAAASKQASKVPVAPVIANIAQAATAQPVTETITQAAVQKTVATVVEQGGQITSTIFSERMVRNLTETPPPTITIDNSTVEIAQKAAAGTALLAGGAASSKATAAAGASKAAAVATGKAAATTAGTATAGTATTGAAVGTTTTTVGAGTATTGTVVGTTTTTVATGTTGTAGGGATATTTAAGVSKATAVYNGLVQVVWAHPYIAGTLLVGATAGASYLVYKKLSSRGSAHLSAAGGGAPGGPEKPNNGKNEKVASPQPPEEGPKERIVRTPEDLMKGIQMLRDRYAYDSQTKAYRLIKGKQPVHPGIEYISRDMLHNEIELWYGPENHAGAMDPLTHKIYKAAKLGRTL